MSCLYDKAYSVLGFVFEFAPYWIKMRLFVIFAVIIGIFGIFVMAQNSTLPPSGSPPQVALLGHRHHKNHSNLMEPAPVRPPSPQTSSG